MRPAAIAAAVLLAAAACRSEEPSIASLTVTASHGNSAAGGAESIRVRMEASGPSIEVEVRNAADGEKSVKTKAEVTKAQLDALVRLARGRGLLQWDSPPPPAPDWGEESYAIEGDATHSAIWNAPLEAAMPPSALLRAMGDLHKDWMPRPGAGLPADRAMGAIQALAESKGIELGR